MSGTAFRGVSSTADTRFGNKEKKLLKSTNFPKEYDIKIDLRKVNWEVMKTWITTRVTALLGTEDEVLVNYVCEQFEGQQTVDPRLVQLNLTGFLEKNTSLFVKELWLLLASAAEQASGIPKKLLDEKQAELDAQHKMRAAIEGKIKEKNRRDRREQEEQDRREARRQQDAQRERERERAERGREDRERYERKRAAERAEWDRRREAEKRADNAREERRQAERERSRRHRDRSVERTLQGTARRSSPSPPAAENGSKRSRKEAEDSASPKLKKAKKEKKDKKERKDKKEKRERKEKKSKKERRGQSEESGSGSEQSGGQKRSLEDELRQKALLSVKKD